MRVTGKTVRAVHRHQDDLVKPKALVRSLGASVASATDRPSAKVLVPSDESQARMCYLWPRTLPRHSAKSPLIVRSAGINHGARAIPRDILAV